MSFAEVFFEECATALAFLVSERGWREVQREHSSLVARVAYLKHEIALEVVLDWRDFDISAYVSLWERAQNVWRVDESGRVVRVLLDLIADRSWFVCEECRALWLPAKVVKQAMETRDLDLCRLWFRSELGKLGIVLRDWEEEILTRARTRLGAPANPDRGDWF